MREVGHLSGGAGIYRRFPIRASVANRGVISRAVTDAVGIDVCTTTSFVDNVGLILEAATYTTTQADLDDPGSDANIGAGNTFCGLDMGRVVTVSIRPDLVIAALATGAAAENTALELLSNTAASAGGTLISDTDITEDQISGIVWCISGNNVGHARVCSAFSDNVSLTVTVPFPRAIAVGDEFLIVPWGCVGTAAADIDGAFFLQTSTLFTQANASIASGTGGDINCVYLELNGRSDTQVHFTLRGHILNNSLVAI